MSMSEVIFATLRISETSVPLQDVRCKNVTAVFFAIADE